jgi:hypothetical protein
VHAQVPVALWALWAEVGISNATLYGWWLSDVLGPSALPVQASSHSDSVKVTTYALDTQAILTVASFAPIPLDVSLVFNSSLLQLPQTLTRYCLYAPALPPFQPSSSKYNITATFTVPPGQGWIFQLMLC